MRACSATWPSRSVADVTDPAHLEALARRGQGDTLAWSHLGRERWRVTWGRQLAAWQSVQDGSGPERVFTLEHEPVITVGRRGSLDDLRVTPDMLRARGVDLIGTNRGGELTYHGPGQLVVYAIVACVRRNLFPADLVRSLAGAVGDVLDELGVATVYDDARPGLWHDGAKVAAVGMRISRGVSLHGAAVNVTTDLDAFSLFVPCGLPDAATTSLQRVLGEAPTIPELGARVAQRFAARLGFALQTSTAPAPSAIDDDGTNRVVDLLG